MCWRTTRVLKQGCLSVNYIVLFEVFLFADAVGAPQPALRLHARRLPRQSRQRHRFLLRTSRPPSRRACRPRLAVRSLLFVVLRLALSAPLRLAMEDVLASSGPPRRAVSTSSGGGAAGGASAGAPSSAGPSGADAANASGVVDPPSAINTVALPPKPQFPALSGKALPVCCGCNLFGNSATSVSCDWTPYFSSLPCVLVILTLSLVCWLFVPRLWVVFSSRRLYLL